MEVTFLKSIHVKTIKNPLKNLCQIDVYLFFLVKIRTQNASPPQNLSFMKEGDRAAVMLYLRGGTWYKHKWNQNQGYTISTKAGGTDIKLNC